MKFVDLEKYRDKDGFIILDSIYESFPKKIETKGTSEKEWLILEDNKILLKFTKTDTYEAYAELLGEETYRFFDIPTAHYDLIKLNGRIGVLSVDVRKEGEVMIQGDNIIINYGKIITENNDGCLSFEVTPYFNTLLDIEEALKYSFAKDSIQSIMRGLDWTFGVACLTLDIDKHLRNWAILLSVDSGKCRLSPQYDMAATGRFHLSKSRISRFCRNYYRTNKESYRDRLIRSDIFGGEYEKRATLRYDREDDNVIGISSFIYAYKKDPNRFWEIVEKVLTFEPESVVNSVETRINAKIPEECKKWFVAVCTTNLNIIKNFLDSYDNENERLVRR